MNKNECRQILHASTSNRTIFGQDQGFKRASMRLALGSMVVLIHVRLVP
jgi:hypothetical protein